jgi:hypothetical protein
MNRIIRCFFLIFILAGALAGCSKKGQLNGQLTSPNQPAVPVTIQFKSDLGGGTGGKIWTTLPSGETYTGKYLQITTTTEERGLSPLWTGWTPYWRDWGPFGGPWQEGPDFTAFRTNYSDKVVATLSGNQGDTMRCRLHLKEPVREMAGGGTGECQTSKRERIEVQF